MVRSVFFVILSLIFILYIFNKVKSKSFSEKDSMFWIAGGFLMIVLSLFPTLIDSISVSLGIYYPPSLLFLLSIIFVVFIILRQSQQISIMNERIKELAQDYSILEQKIRNENCKPKDNED